MKKSIFKVKKLQKEKIVVEEEKSKNHPFFFFFYFLKRNWNPFIIISTIIGVTTIGLGTGITISLVKNTGDFDISYISGGDTVNTNPSDDEEVEKELLGNIAITDGVVLVTKKFMTAKGDIITYYSDGTSLIVTSKGVIKRVVPLEDGSYAIDENGNIDSMTIRKIVTATTATLDDGTVITYYSDGSAEITKDKNTVFVRNSNNIKFDLTTTNQVFQAVNPSLVSLTKKNSTEDNYKYTEFLNGSVLVEKDGTKYLVHNKEDINLESNNFSFPNNNAHIIKDTLQLSDGNTIEYYTDGSAIIINQNNDKIIVRKSGDIVIKNNSIYEIVPNKKAIAMDTITTLDGKKITYYDNAAAIIEKNNGTKEYIEDSSQIKLNSNKNITSIPKDKSDQDIQKTLPDGTKVTTFDNGKTQIIDNEGNNYIINTEDLTFDISGNIETPPPVTSETKPTSQTSPTSETSGTGKPGNGGIADGEIDMSEAENEWNYSKSLENSSFVITNKNKHARNFRIVIEEVKNYSKFNAVSIATKKHEAAYYVKYQATFGNEIIPATRLSDKKDTENTSANSYIIYEGTLGAKSNLKANIILYIDYEPLDNSFQNKAFIGTIKLYYIEDTDE